MQGKDWIEYQCKSGQTLFTYNKETGEHKWPLGLPEGIEYRIICSRPVEHKQVSSTATQTDDNGCNNGCMSMYINAHPSLTSDTPLTPKWGGISNEGNSLQTVKIEEDSESSGMVTAHENNLAFTCNGDDNDDDDDDDDYIEKSSGDADNQFINHENLYTISEILQDIKQRKSLTESDTFIADRTVVDDVCNSKEEDHTKPFTKSGSVISNRTVVASNYNEEDMTSHYNDSTAHENDYDDNVHKGGDHHGDINNSTNDIIVDSNNDDDAGCVDNSNDDHKSNDETIIVDVDDDTACGSHDNSLRDILKDEKGMEGSGKNDSKECKSDLVDNGAHTKHMRKHSKEKSYECSICKRKFNHKRNLNTHVKIHSGDEQYCCNFCNKVFSYKSSLRNHARIHTGEKPFECQYCEKKFNQKAHHTEHENTHTGVKPHECPVCFKRFTHRKSYGRHVKIHTRVVHADRKPYLNAAFAK